MMRPSLRRSLLPVIGLSLISAAQAQEPPVAQPVQGFAEVEGALVADAANDFFERGKNLYDEARAMEDALERKRLFTATVQIFEAYLMDFPNHENAAKAWWYAGSSYQQIERHKDANRCFSAILQRFQKGPWVSAAAYALAADHYNKKQYVVAAPLFERYAANAQREGEAARGYYYAGHCYRLNGAHAQAMVAFRKVLNDEQAGAFTPMAKVGLGHCSLHLKRNQEALDLFVEVTETEASDSVKAEALLNAAVAARQLGKLEIAAHYLERILGNDQMKAWWPSAHSAVLSVLFEQNEFAKLVKMHRESAIKLGGEREAARLMLVGRALMRLLKPKEALELFRAVERQVAPESDLAFQASYYRLLCFYRIEGKHVPDQVDAFLQLYGASRPNDMRIHTALMMKAESLQSEGKLAAAAQVYNKVDEKKVSEANRPGLLYQRGWCLAEAGDQGGAIRSLSLFVDAYPKDERIASAIAKRAKVHERAGHLDQALKDYDRLIKLGKPSDMAVFGWLESARLRRGAKQIEDMMIRYQGLLESGLVIDDKLKSEANYWLGWGMVKTNKPKLSIAPLEKARKLRADLYGKHAGILLALGYFAAQNIEKLAEEVHMAIAGEYQDDLPDQAIQWVGMQSYNAGSYRDAAIFLALIANFEEARETPKEVWRYLGKSLLENDMAQDALPAINNVLEMEQNPAWIADGLLDRGHALFKLNRLKESREAVEKALAMQPQGRTRGGLRLLAGDLDLKEGDPKKASAQYLIVVSFINDKQLKPLALHKLSAAQEQAGELTEAEKYRQQLLKEFPDWKAP